MQLKPHERILLPVDKSELREPDITWLERLGEHVGGFKSGLESLMAKSPYRAGSIGFGVLTMANHLGIRSMVDGKFNDIPNTVGNAVRNVARRNAWGITVMASAGMDALKAAVDNRGDSLIIGVTVLTSLTPEECKSIYGRIPTGQVAFFADLLVEAGVQAIVCSPLELEIVRKNVGDKLICITPGIRGKDAKPDDQNRTMTPMDAIKAGADYLVIGRPIMQAADPVGAARAIGDEIAQASSNLSMV